MQWDGWDLGILGWLRRLLATVVAATACLAVLKLPLAVALPPLAVSAALDLLSPRATRDTPLFTRSATRDAVLAPQRPMGRAAMLFAAGTVLSAAVIPIVQAMTASPALRGLTAAAALVGAAQCGSVLGPAWLRRDRCFAAHGEIPYSGSGLWWLDGAVLLWLALIAACRGTARVILAAGFRIVCSVLLMAIWLALLLGGLTYPRAPAELPLGLMGSVLFGALFQVGFAVLCNALLVLRWGWSDHPPARAVRRAPMKRTVEGPEDPAR